ncbi:hypothetical protein WOLCODRAFT_157996 [Wolfiporia cocos MD-104 SS10]|uniref:Uncharacterized protein n=1 Tax=Wolfiporia cocos (strain MD-104) TaxID=742152 RepID=A0A2H3JEW6_WOLCO|nr:hypothetical protein WOLCODRAFT_157996 [Wolfiporia cocos MD-104 SS10]
MHPPWDVANDRNAPVFPNNRKDHHDDAAWLVPWGAAPASLTSDGAKRASRDLTAKLLDGAAPDSTDFGGTVPPPPVNKTADVNPSPPRL